DLAAGPLLRARVIKLAPHRYLLLANVHHIVFDGWSARVLVDELVAAYAACLRGERLQLSPLAVQYKDFAAWQNSLLEGNASQRDGDYWHGQFSGKLTALDLPNDFAHPAIWTFSGDRVSFLMDEPLSEALRGTARSMGGSLFMMLVALVKALLY